MIEIWLLGFAGIAVMTAGFHWQSSLGGAALWVVLTGGGILLLAAIWYAAEKAF